jgi:hypothetical protein
MGKGAFGNMDIDSEEEAEASEPGLGAGGGDVDRITAGPILEIVMENFMCHSNTKVELSPRVNFITGQNGSKCAVSKCAVSMRTQKYAKVANLFKKRHRYGVR